MRTIIITLISIILYQILLAQKTEVYYGVSGRMDVVEDIIEIYDKGYYILGGFDGGNGYYNGWNIKTDINLEMLYDKVLEHDLSTVAQFASVSDENGNIYITGFTTYMEQWPFVTKLDSCGNKVWCKILDHSSEFNYGWALDIIITNNNEIVLLGYFDSDEEIALIHLVGLSQEGHVNWIKPYASRNDHSWIREPSGLSIIQINDEYYISGDCYWPYPDDTTHFFQRPLFIGIDSLFNEKWILPFAVMDSIYGNAYSSISINDTLIMGVGKRRYYDNMVYSLLMFFNKNGVEFGYNQITNEQIGPNIKRNSIYDIERINDTLFLTASFFGTENSGNPVGEFVIDTAGNLYNFQSRPNTVTSPNLIKTTDNKYVIATSIKESKSDWDIYLYKINENLESVPFDINQYTYDSLCPHQIQSGTIDLSDCLIVTDIGEIPSPEQYYAKLKTIPIKVFPNPAKENITLSFENTKYHQNMQLECFDIFGRKVHKEKIYKGQLETEINISQWNEGLYVAVVMSEGKVLGKVKFVVLK